MKQCIVCAVMILALDMFHFAHAGDKPLADRPISIAFQAMLHDEAGLSYDGLVGVEALFYNAHAADPANLVYAESFADVDVEHGSLRVPLLTGIPEQGTSFSKEVFAATAELYVDIKVDGVTMISLHPMNSSFSAIRADFARKAEGMRLAPLLDPADIPVHSASLITTGTFDSTRIPVFDAKEITSGIFGIDQVPSISGQTITDGPFPAAMLPSDFDAKNDFSGGSLEDTVISDTVFRKGKITLAHGVAEDGHYLTMPGDAPRENCKILLGMNHAEIDSDGDGIDWWQIYNDSGTVRCRFSHREDLSDRRLCTANYLIICVQ